MAGVAMRLQMLPDACWASWRSLRGVAKNRVSRLVLLLCIFLQALVCERPAAGYMVLRAVSQIDSILCGDPVVS